MGYIARVNIVVDREVTIKPGEPVQGKGLSKEDIAEFRQQGYLSTEAEVRDEPAAPKSGKPKPKVKEPPKAEDAAATEEGNGDQADADLPDGVDPKLGGAKDK